MKLLERTSIGDNWLILFSVLKILQLESKNCIRTRAVNSKMIINIRALYCEAKNYY
jgi:hypothetical protein